MGGEKLMPLVSGIEEDSSTGKQIAERRAQIFQDVWVPQLRPFPRTRELVERIASDGYTLAVATSAKQEELQPLLEVAGVSDLFSLRTSSDDADRSKPDPDIVKAALERAECPAERAIMIGDTPYDVAAATRAHVRVIGFECGGWERSDLRGAIEVYRDASELLDRYDSSLLFTLSRAA
jgi:HAD superfamily hydrolase (TIGR01549 family)